MGIFAFMIAANNFIRGTTMSLRFCLIFCAALAILVSSGVGQTPVSDRVSVSLSDPSRPAVVEARLIHGGITVRGYEGTEIIVEATVRTRPVRERKESEAARGMIRIENRSTGLSVVEENNTVEIDTSSHTRAVDLDIQVPRRTSLQVATVNDGEIVVENIVGDLEVINTNGSVDLRHISGSAVVHALNDDIKVTFDQVSPDKAMAFSSMNGDIDVTFPGDIKANLVMRSREGEIYSDFEIILAPGSREPIVEDERSTGGAYRVRIDRSISGTLNGGGPEIQFKNFNGSIYIRRAGR
jgi:hypothetical protein